MSKSSITTDEASAGERLAPIHPGEVLREEFMTPLQIAAEELARGCGLPLPVIEALSEERAPIDAEAALRLGRYLGTSAELWLGMQMQFDIERAEDSLHEEIARIRPRSLAAAE